MDIFLESKDSDDAELKNFTESRVKFSLKRLFWMVQKIQVRYSTNSQSNFSGKQYCQISLETFDHRQIEVSITARDKRTALDMGLKKITKLIQKAFRKSQKYGRLSKYVYV